MDTETIVKCHALLCEIRGVVKQRGDWPELELELNELITEFEVLLKNRNRNKRDWESTVRRTAWWLSFLFNIADRWKE